MILMMFSMSVMSVGFGTDVEQSQNQIGINKIYNDIDVYNKANGTSIAISGRGGDNSVTFNEPDGVKYSGSFRVKNTPNLGSIPVAASSASFNNGTCYGTIGGQGTIAGTGIGVSSTVEDEKCSRRYLAALAANLGTKEDGLRVACLEPEMLQANPKLCNKVYDAPTVATTAGDKINLTYRPKNDVASNNNGFIDF